MIKIGKFTFGSAWSKSNGFQRRKYASYDEYVGHQAAKLATLNLKSYEAKFSAALTERLSRCDFIDRGMNVLCLGARTGIECKVFADACGCFPIGIDLNPGEKNLWVVSGDFHQLQYADSSVDIAYSNALDHAFDLDKILAEVRRVLRNGGMMIAEIVDPAFRGPGEYEALWWDNTDQVVQQFRKSGFEIARQESFEVPWQGLHAAFRLVK